MSHVMNDSAYRHRNSYPCFAMAKMIWMLNSKDLKGTRKMKDGRMAVTDLI